jgi:hypothetical protein
VNRSRTQKRIRPARSGRSGIENPPETITGMTSIFVGAYWPVIGMGVALEVGKLSAVAWLGHQGGTSSWRLRAALTILVAVLMGLNAVGCYGFLAKAHIGHQVESDVTVAGRAADVEARIQVQADLVADLDRRIGQIDGAVEKSTAKGRTNAAMQLAADQRRNRTELAAQRDRRTRFSPSSRSRRPRSTARGRSRRPTWARSDTSPRCSAPATRMSCAGSSWSLRSCCCWRRPGGDPYLLHRRGGGAEGRDYPADRR